MTQNIVKEEFDSKAATYESNRLSDWYKSHSELIAKCSAELIKGNVLDIGCATGYQLRLLRRICEDCDMIGLDLSPSMISVARASSSSDLDIFLVEDWEDLSTEALDILSRKRFDTIICANTFHYFKNPQAAVSRMAELMDSNGSLLVLEREQENSFLTRIWGLLHKFVIKDQVTFYSAESIGEMMIDAGFKNVGAVSKIRKYFWKGKLFTSIVLMRGER